MKLLDLHQIALRLLERDPDPVVRFRLMRDVLAVPRNDDAYLEARARRGKNRWVRELAAKQRPDGSWGPFHLLEAPPGRRAASTEQAVREATLLGLEPQDDMLKRAGGHMVAMLTGAVAFAGSVEDTPLWPAMERILVGSALALVDPYVPVLDRIMADARTLLEEAFAGGVHNPKAETRAWQKIAGALTTGACLSLSARTFLQLFGPRLDELPLPLEDAYAGWLWRRKSGVDGLDVPLFRRPALDSAALGRWLASLELLSPFPSSRAYVSESLAWLWEQRNQKGLWDFGPRAGDKDLFQLSSTWRTPAARENDHSTRVLLVLTGYTER